MRSRVGRAARWRHPAVAAALLTLLAGSVSLRGAERGPGPLSAVEEAATFRLADTNLVIELVAAEPAVVSPVALCWDARGRMFVAEMIDYPTGPTAGRIRMLEGVWGQGSAVRATDFAEGLNFPNGVLPWKNGLLVTAAPDILFLEDRGGAGRAEAPKVVLTGFGTGNQQLRVNGLLWGLDNWVYGANGRSEGEVRQPGEAAAPAVSIRGHDFRFRPGTRQFEPLAGRSQFGLARDDWGQRFLSWNTVPMRHEVLPERYLNRNRHLALTESLDDILPPDDLKQVFQISPLPKVFNDEPPGYFNASCGLTLLRGGGLGESYRGNAFVCEPLRNLVHRRTLRSEGATFVAERGEQGKEFMASTDPWFHPVNLATGPDGALYVADFYRQWVEHPDFIPEAMRSKVAWRTGAEHGRVWRIRRKDRPPAALSQRPPPAAATAAELVKLLADDNGWWRDTAQRLLVERQEPGTAGLLLGSFPGWLSSRPVAAVHALWTLAGLEALDERTLLVALAAGDPGVREQAVMLAEPRLNASRGLRQAVTALADDAAPRVAFQVSLSLGGLTDQPSGAALARLAERGKADPWRLLAVLTSLGERPWDVLRRLLDRESDWQATPTAAQARFLDHAGRLVGARNDPAELRAVWVRTETAALAPGHIVLHAGVAQGLARGGGTWWAHLAPAAGAGDPPAELGARLAALEGVAQAPEAPVYVRRAAIELLARAPAELARKSLLAVSQAAKAPESQAAAVRALIGIADPAAAAAVLSGWNGYGAAVRRQLLAATLERRAALPALLEALECRTIQAAELDVESRRVLAKVEAPELRARVERLLERFAAPDRVQVVAAYQPALALTGDRQRGANVFGQHCVVCHAVQGQGGHVGPDLSTVASRPKAALLEDVLDPSRQVSPDFISYSVVTTDDEEASGVILAETPNGFTLRRPNAPDLTLLRTQVRECRADGKSMMPDGFEQVLDRAAFADLLEFLRQPDKALVPWER